jgi:hypothetical protein
MLDTCDEHAIPCGFVDQEERREIIAQGLLQAVHHAPA